MRHNLRVPAAPEDGPLLALDPDERGYLVRVRSNARYFWGSSGITQVITFASPLVLHLRNDPLGTTVTLGTNAAGTETALGSIGPGEAVSIPLQNLTGVYGQSTSSSVVHCTIRGS